MKFFPKLKKIAAVAAVSALVLQPAAPALAAGTFSDIAGHWAKQDILRLGSQGLVNGYQGQFSPEGRVTRAQLATMLVNALGLADQAQAVANLAPEFRDVAATHWAAGYITVAREYGLISGYDDNTFRPDQPIRRDELGAMLVRALKFAPDAHKSPADLPFKDRNAIPSWAAPELALAQERGLIAGYEDGTFRPARYTTRAEAAVLINRLLAQRGQAFDFAGQVTAVDQSARSLTVDIQGQRQTLSYLSNVLVYEGKLALSPAALQPGDKIWFNLNHEGKITYIEKNNSLQLFSWSGGSRKVAAARQPEGEKTIRLEKQGGWLLAEGEKDPLVNPEESLEVTKAEMDADEFTRTTGSDGRGQIVAIIDTGVDPGHPDLRATTWGAPKIVDWVDFTSEGQVRTDNATEAANGFLPLTGGNYKVGSIESRSGSYHYGFWREAAGDTEIDANLNGTSGDSFAVLVVDSETAGLYDTVYVDTNSNKDFTDENPLRVYREEQQFASFPEVNGLRFNFVVSKIEANGAAVQLGFDGNDHGTHVAGIVAANGRLKGVAPGAQIMALKALDSAGAGSEYAVIQAINYAALNGAKIINLSFGFPPETGDGKGSLAQLVTRLAKEKGITFVIASGNDGPGLSTVATPGDASGAISVGAYISPAMWQRDFGWKVPVASLWFFSSVGPRRDGGVFPTLVAPGSVVSTGPAWKDQGYLFNEGTSMAAPHVAGAVALLLEGATKEGLSVTPALIKRALELGARELTGFSSAEQGYGLVNVPRAWNHLKKLRSLSTFTNLVYNEAVDLGEGLFSRGHLPGEMDFYLRSQKGLPTRVDVSSTVGWLEPLQSRLLLPAGKQRILRTKFDLSQEPGLYSGRLQIDDPATYSPDLEILATVINPYEFFKGQGYRLDFQESLNAGRYKRYFIRVPEGAESLNTTLTINRNEQGGFLGRARIHLYNPSGEEIDKDLTDFAGVGYQHSKAQVEKTVYQPEAGVWEVIVYSSATLSEYSLTSSQYRLDIGLSRVVRVDSPKESGNIFFGLLPGALKAGQDGYLTLQIREQASKRPYQGVLEVNGLLYSVRGGRLTLPVRPSGAIYPVTVKTVVDNKNKQQLEYKIDIPVN